MDTALNIVVVEDHDALREVTVEALCNMNHNAVGVDCAEALVDEIGAFPIDLLVVDLNLPGEDGISLARRLRSVQPDVGIIMMTARSQISEKLSGYENGADLYLTKPISVEELGAAVGALARRIKRREQDRPGFVLNRSGLFLQGSQGGVGLSAHEAAMLSALARAPGRRLESWQLIELSGKADADLSKSTLEVQIVRLRKKLMQAGAVDQPIKAVRGQGYQLCIEVTVA
ncbi:response regulator transcription factor [Candidatus Methylobacter oryzae]|uniref:Response regulator transcription factor n=1 Tax=Candidatus Methylobacter oryzae TaxID=2497749 RepID=A0ABY3CAN5_9GAMM|nr:response regulator transcription factor [Candidatus Methylobacter oryzae]TRW95548.1 response regulator transcription factor [Candidatus Methylobacter oryzae]